MPTQAAPVVARATKSTSEGEDTREPKGPWQTPSLTLIACTRHQGRCAYRQGDHERCDYCHADWLTITGKWHETREEHTGQHARDDEISNTKAVRRAVTRHRRLAEWSDQ